MWWSEILAKIPELGLKMSLSEEQCFKVLPLISILILISKPAAEVLNHFPGNRESHTKMQGQEYQAKVVCFSHLPLITQRMMPKHGRRRAGALWQAQNSDVVQTGETSFSCAVFFRIFPF